MRIGLIATLFLAAAATPLGAQNASLRGRVLTDSTERPIAGVVVEIAELKIQATTDSLGNFTLPGIRPGVYVVSAKKIGFGALATRVRFAARDALDADFLMTPNVQSLPGVKVETPATLPPKLLEFEERRAEGFGRFLTQADLEKRQFRSMADVVRQMPGLEIYRNKDKQTDLYVVAGRLSVPSCALCGGNQLKPPCFAAVVVDGAFVSGASGEPFNINSINPDHLAGIEYYAGTAAMPVKYNGTRNTCGLMILWTK